MRWEARSTLGWPACYWRAQRGGGLGKKRKRASGGGIVSWLLRFPGLGFLQLSVLTPTDLLDKIQEETMPYYNIKIEVLNLQKKMYISFKEETFYIKTTVSCPSPFSISWLISLLSTFNEPEKPLSSAWHPLTTLPNVNCLLHTCIFWRQGGFLVHYEYSVFLSNSSYK